MKAYKEGQFVRYAINPSYGRGVVVAVRPSEDRAVAVLFDGLDGDAYWFHPNELRLFPQQEDASDA